MAYLRYLRYLRCHGETRQIPPDLIEVLPRIPGMQPVVWSSLLQAGLQLSGIHSRDVGCGTG